MINEETAERILGEITPETLAGWWVRKGSEIDMVTKISILIHDSIHKPIKVVLNVGGGMTLEEFLTEFKYVTDNEACDVVHRAILARIEKGKTNG